MTIRDYEEIAARQAFDPDCTISPENLELLVDDYHFAGDIEYPCQVEREGGRCNESHKRGWLGRRKDDGHEALIGRDCGRKKFKASAVFHSERRRLNEVQTLQTNLKRVQKHLDNFTYAEELGQILQRLQAVVAALGDVRDRLPSAIVSQLERRARGDDADVFVSFRYDDEDADGNPTYRWDAERIGILSCLSIWNPEPIRVTFCDAASHS